MTPKQTALAAVEALPDHATQGDILKALIEAKAKWEAEHGVTAAD